MNYYYWEDAAAAMRRGVDVPLRVRQRLAEEAETAAIEGHLASSCTQVEAELLAEQTSAEVRAALQLD